MPEIPDKGQCRKRRGVKDNRERENQICATDENVIA